MSSWCQYIIVKYIGLITCFIFCCTACQNRVVISIKSVKVPGAILPVQRLKDLSLQNLMDYNASKKETISLWPITCLRLPSNEQPLDPPGDPTVCTQHVEHEDSDGDQLDLTQDKELGLSWHQALGGAETQPHDLANQSAAHNGDFDMADDQAARNRTKLDPIHSMLRLDETLLKSHGAYQVQLVL